MRIGSDAHKALFCDQFLATHVHYRPETLPWPELDADALSRLRAVPFWQEVLHTERRAGRIVEAFAATLTDPLIHRAVALQGVEETRHAALLREMIRRYGIDVVETALEPVGPDVETAFIDFGFGECLDSFLGFGAFKLARESQFLPEPMFGIFETLMVEETRHIVFFVNWMAWREAAHGRRAAWARAGTSLRYYLRAIRRLAGTARRGAAANDGKDFSATQASLFLDGFSFRRFVADCYGENARRMAAFDPALLRPGFLPAVADMALTALRLWDRARPGRRANSAPGAAP